MGEIRHFIVFFMGSSLFFIPHIKGLKKSSFISSGSSDLFSINTLR